jgi:hypothetical protein
VRERDIRLSLGAPLSVDGCHRGAVVKRSDVFSEVSQGIDDTVITCSKVTVFDTRTLFMTVLSKGKLWYLDLLLVGTP